MRGKFGGLGAWGMFAALIAVCALMFGVTDQGRKQANDLSAEITWAAGAPAPLIVSLVEPTVDKTSAALCGYQLALAEERHSEADTGKEATAQVLLLHQSCTVCQYVAVSHLRHCADSRQRAGPYFVSDGTEPSTNRGQITASTSASRHDRRFRLLN